MSRFLPEDDSQWQRSRFLLIFRGQYYHNHTLQLKTEHELLCPRQISSVRCHLPRLKLLFMPMYRVNFQCKKPKSKQYPKESANKGWLSNLIHGSQSSNPSVLTPAYHHFPEDMYLIFPNVWWAHKKVKSIIRKITNPAFPSCLKRRHSRTAGMLPEHTTNLKQISFAENSRKGEAGKAENVREIPQRHCNQGTSRGFTKRLFVHSANPQLCQTLDCNWHPVHSGMRTGFTAAAGIWNQGGIMSTGTYRRPTGLTKSSGTAAQ